MRTQGKNVRQKPWTDAAYSLVSRPTCLGMVPLTVGWVFKNLLPINKITTDMFTGPLGTVEGFSSRYVKLATKISHCSYQGVDETNSSASVVVENVKVTVATSLNWF